MLKDRRTYEIMRPEDVGVPQATLVLGKHSGRHAVQRRCEQLGVTLDAAASSIRSTAPSSRSPIARRSSTTATSRHIVATRPGRRRKRPSRVGRTRLLVDPRRERLRARGVDLAARCWLLHVDRWLPYSLSAEPATANRQPPATNTLQSPPCERSHPSSSRRRYRS